MNKQQYKEEAYSLARYLRAWYFDEIRERIEWDNDLNIKSNPQYLLKDKKYQEEIDKVFDEGDVAELESEEYDHMFNMEDIVYEIENFDYETNGAKDEMIWETAYLQGLRTAMDTK